MISNHKFLQKLKMLPNFVQNVNRSNTNCTFILICLCQNLVSNVLKVSNITVWSSYFFPMISNIATFVFCRAEILNIW